MNLRNKKINELVGNSFDILIIGGGINGAVAAASLAARGAQVALVDKGDFAGCTSQNSSNLVWGASSTWKLTSFPLCENSASHVTIFSVPTLPRLRKYVFTLMWKKNFAIHHACFIGVRFFIGG